MNRIVREHYPVAELPETLREGLEPNATVRVTIEQEDRTSAGAERVMTLDEMFDFLPRRFATVDDAVVAIRRQRAEWND